jgi:hypothetical protein
LLILLRLTPGVDFRLAFGGLSGEPLALRLHPLLVLGGPLLACQFGVPHCHLPSTGLVSGLILALGGCRVREYVGGRVGYDGVLGLGCVS